MVSIVIFLEWNQGNWWQEEGGRVIPDKLQLFLYQKTVGQRVCWV